MTELQRQRNKKETPISVARKAVYRGVVFIARRPLTRGARSGSLRAVHDVERGGWRD